MFQVTQFFLGSMWHKQGAFISKLGILFYLITFLHDTRKRRAIEKAREISEVTTILNRPRTKYLKLTTRKKKVHVAHAHKHPGKMV